MIKLILTDIDGVWTDGGMYYDNEGNELKKFCTYDGVGVSLAHKYGIKVGILTGEDTEIVRRRAEKLNVDYIYQGVKDKLKKYWYILGNFGYSHEEIAYIGDDINDFDVIRHAFLSACPNSAFSDDVKKYANFVTKRNGGEGCFREFVEYIIHENNSQIQDNGSAVKD